MHGPIRDRLEDLLKADSSTAAHGDLDYHLVSCDECSSELEAMKGQSLQFAMLRPQESAEPAPGFYARVLQRIEAQQTPSVWDFFIESGFSKRLALASLTVAIALGSYVITEENRTGKGATASMVAQNYDSHFDAPVMGNQTEQRDAVLVNFVEHQGEVR